VTGTAPAPSQFKLVGTRDSGYGKYGHEISDGTISFVGGSADATVFHLADGDEIFITTTPGTVGNNNDPLDTPIYFSSQIPPTGTKISYAPSCREAIIVIYSALQISQVLTHQ
jgi:hypothetical protein